MQERIVKKVVMVLVSLISVLLLIFTLDYHRKIVFFSDSKMESRERVKSLSQKIEIDSDKREVIHLLKQEMQSLKGFEFRQHPTQLEIRSPIEFPGLTWSWNIYVQFKSGKVSGVFIRPIDGNFRFCSAPSDRGIIPNMYQVPASKECV